MYIFFGEKGEMIYFVCAWAAMIIFVIIWYFIRRKRINAAIKRLNELNAEITKRQNEVEIEQRTLDELTKKITASTLAIAKLDNDRIVVTQRAAEARSATDRLLAAEHERAAAELSRVKEVEELRLQQQFKDKEALLENQFLFKKRQFTEDFNEFLDAQVKVLNDLKDEVADYAAKQSAIHEAILRERELEEKEDF